MILRCSSLAHTIPYIHEQKVYYLFIHVNARDNDPGETFRRVPKGGKGGGVWRGWWMRRKLAVLTRRLVLSRKHERASPETRSEFQNDFIARTSEFYPSHAFRLSRVSATFTGETVQQRFHVRRRPLVTGTNDQCDKMPRPYACVHSHAKHVIPFTRCHMAEDFWSTPRSLFPRRS